MPQKELENWFDVFRRIEQRKHDDNNVAFYSHKHSYVYEMYEENERNHKWIPSYLHIMRHTYRANPFQDGTNTKCFHRTDKVFALHTHYPMRCINRTNYHHNCDGIEFDENNESLLMHYRPNRQPDKQCMMDKTIKQILHQCTVNDHTAWKWYDQLARIIFYLFERELGSSNAQPKALCH
ncbi:hypothetical protein BLA29_006202 [Euroglyphus maynei]|uniref:Uncharacterized protein n=1 Tax=Euroglyphus maynei TaxID=6958 RepID=A0A1Y3AMR5_EURMA|nr:hypothetical protein BLA29_006202 [Euroglyphus maynei]